MEPWPWATDQPPCSMKPAGGNSGNNFSTSLSPPPPGSGWTPQRLNYTRSQKTRMDIDTGDRDGPLRAQRQVDKGGERCRGDQRWLACSLSLSIQKHLLQLTWSFFGGQEDASKLADANLSISVTPGQLHGQMTCAEGHSGPMLRRTLAWSKAY